MDLLLFLRPAKCLIYSEQFLATFQICFLKNLHLSDRWLICRHTVNRKTWFGNCHVTLLFWKDMFETATSSREPALHTHSIEHGRINWAKLWQRSKKLFAIARFWWIYRNTCRGGNDRKFCARCYHKSKFSAVS